MRARFDLVGFDPRGIARSTALRCFGSPRQWEPAFQNVAFPLTPGELDAWIAAERYVVDACDQRGGQLIDHMATADVARDMDRLRAAVGDDQLTYAGVSYGSYLGVTYANLFPDRVRAVVVDGVLDPIAWSTGRGNEAATLPFSTRLQSDVGAQATLNEFFRLCDAGGARCAFSGGAAARYAAANPVLAVGNLFDPATPYQGAQTVDALLPNSALLTVHGWGHTSLFLSGCADEAIARYLVDRRTPAPGTVCEQDVVPFAGP